MRSLRRSTAQQRKVYIFCMLDGLGSGFSPGLSLRQAAGVSRSPRVGVRVVGWSVSSSKFDNLTARVMKILRGRDREDGSRDGTPELPRGDLAFTRVPQSSVFRAAGPADDGSTTSVGTTLAA